MSYRDDLAAARAALDAERRARELAEAEVRRLRADRRRRTAVEVASTGAGVATALIILAILYHLLMTRFFGER